MPDRTIVIETPKQRPLDCRDWDPRAPVVAEALIEAIRARDSRISAEHVGSSSVPGCAGKGVIDLMVTYEPGDLEAAKRALDDLGFRHQTGRDPFPEDRPLRIGMVRHDGTAFGVHAHVIGRHSPEMEEMRLPRQTAE